jgi:formylglycine-generating enzyme required for sulfatase activity
VRIASDAGSYCIDSTEVSNSQYAEFLDAGFSSSATVPPACVDAGAYAPSAGWPSPYPHQPVANVSWCQAYAFCAWAGKRLCGGIGGGALPERDFANPSASQWFNACSAGGTLAYPYGNTFDVAVCGGERTTNVENVGAPAQCIGGYPGLYNMSGNVWEWTDSCNSTSCYTMGGAYDGTQTDLACTGNRSWTTTAGAPNIGFRCCSNP